MPNWLQPIRVYLGWVFLLVVLTAKSVSAENPKISYAAVPDWVQETKWTDPTNDVVPAESVETRYLLHEIQERPQKSERFVHIAELMVNNNGVQDSGSLRLEFDPAYQELCLHKVMIHRNGKTIDRLVPAQVRLIQPERELDGDMFTGSQTAVLFIEDLRVGDVLEYAYTIRGENPVLEAHFSSRFIIQFGSPVDRKLFRVVWESKLPLHQRLYLTTNQAESRPWGAVVEYVWSFTNLPPIPYEDWQPASYEPYPYVEVSDFADWRSVVNWALPLYESNPTNCPSEMRDLIARWLMSTSSSNARAQMALQFVQDDLRYTGIELGPDSYRPTDPVETFQKRYGDCKGKVVLLRFLLKQMGIESYPALVSSSDHEAIGKRLPSPFVFDHVILLVKLDGKDIWVDPTYSHQGGSFENHYLPHYGKALVIRPGNEALDEVPLNRPENASQQKVVSTFFIKNYKSPVSFTVRNEYSGASADATREDIADSGPTSMAKNYLNYYARLYPGILAGLPLKIHDDRQANVITVEESYTVTNIWTRDEDEKMWQASFYADNLYQALTDPDTRRRNTPLALTYPLLRRQEIVVHLPDKDWQIPDLTTNVENKAFSFNYHRHLAGSTVTYSYECRTKCDTVQVDSVAAYLIKRDQMDNLLSDSLQRSDEKKSSGINYLMVVLAIFGASGTALGCIWYWRRSVVQDAAPSQTSGETHLQGLGGWLIFVAFGLCLAPFIRVFTLSHNWEAYFSSDVWQTVAMPQGQSYHPLYGPLLMFEVLGNIVLLGLNFLALILFFKKRKGFPKLYITLMVCNAVFLVLDDVGCWLIPTLRSSTAGKSHTETTRVLFFAMLWTLYMLRSKRVKATFVK